MTAPATPPYASDANRRLAAYGKCRATWIGGYDVAISCVYDWPHPGSHRNETGTTWDQHPPLTCPDCGSQRWNDESVRWLPSGAEDRRPYCAEACAEDHR